MNNERRPPLPILELASFLILSAVGGCICTSPADECRDPADCAPGMDCVENLCVTLDSGPAPTDSSPPGTDSGPPCPTPLCGVGVLAICCDVGEECVGDVCLVACPAPQERCVGAPPAVCCPSGDVCFSDQCTTPGATCTDFADCQMNEYCEPTLGACLPTSLLPPCEYHPPVGVFSPTVEWRSPSPDNPPMSLPHHLDVLAPPVVADLDGDGLPEVAVGMFDEANDYDGLGSPNTGYTDGVLTILNGEDGTIDIRLDDPADRMLAGVSPSVGDLNSDGVPEVVVLGNNNYLRAYEPDGSLFWEANTPIGFTVNGWGGGIAIADLANDGLPEVFFGTSIYSAFGFELQTIPQDGAYPTVTAADMDGDNDLELVTNRTVYHHDGTMMWERLDLVATPSWGMFSAVADLDSDMLPDVALVLSGSLYILDGLTGVTEWGPIAFPIPPGGDPALAGPGGPPTIADFDGDGLPEISSAGGYFYVVFDPDGPTPILWQATTKDLSSRATGSSVFDFEGDGSAEVVYSDECFTRVYDGLTGAVLFETPNNTRTAIEYPLVADVDGDNNAEILVIANEYILGCQGLTGTLGTPWTSPPYGSAWRGITVYGDALDNWVSTRRIWVGHQYHVTEINGDLSIPMFETPNWTVYNNFRQNVQGGGVFNAPDLMPDPFEAEPMMCPDTLLLRANIRNTGAIGVPAGVPVSFYVDDTMTGMWSLIGTVLTTIPLLPGQSEWVEIPWMPPLGSAGTVWSFQVVVDDDGTGMGVHNECETGGEANNSALLSSDCPGIG